MCTLIALVDVAPGLPLVVAANRDELYGRAAEAPVRLGPGIAGGRDLVAGGSWLAVAADGRVAGVTNQPEPGAPRAARSRGAVVRALIDLPDRAAMRAYLAGLDGRDYAGGNYLYGDPDGVELAFVRRDGSHHTFAPGRGLIVLTNDRLASAPVALAELAGPGAALRDGAGALPVHLAPRDSIQFARASRAASLLAPLAGAPWAELAAGLPAVLADHARPATLPPAPPGFPLGAEAWPAMHALCIHTPHYGTRGSTVAAIDGDGVRALSWADGPPCTTRFGDATGLLRG